jgi:hypothetical protein
MKTLLIGGAIAALAVPALAQVAPVAPAAPAAPMTAHAQKMQTRAEVQAKVAEHFARVDTNRDGVIVKAEADAAHQAMRANMRARFAQRLAARSGGAAPAVRGDGGAAFERLDSNRDGSISRQEWDAGRAARQQRMAARGERAPGARRIGGMRMGGGFGGRMFEMADANKDGRVTLAEAQAAALRHFDTVDSNRDGRITPDERMQRRQHMRMQRRG